MNKPFGGDFAPISRFFLDFGQIAPGVVRPLASRDLGRKW
jgi:hypothetical protein